MASGEAEYIQLGDRSDEHGSYIIEALETGDRTAGISILKTGAHYQSAGWLHDRDSLLRRQKRHPARLGSATCPAVCATCRASISVQEMAVEAALTGNRELVRLAVLHDPLTAAVCNTEEVWRMCDEMFEAFAPWMPQFNGEGRTWPDIPQPNNGVLRFPRSAGDWKPPALAGTAQYEESGRLTVGHKDN